jgi:hypothetical protein
MRAFAAALSLALAAARTHPAPGRYAPQETAGGGTLPHWAPTYEMARSTILQPCNTSGWFDPVLAGRYGVIDFGARAPSRLIAPCPPRANLTQPGAPANATLTTHHPTVRAPHDRFRPPDWSNAKQLWANAKPMDCEERLITQAAMVKAVNPDTKVFVYRNLVKALRACSRAPRCARPRRPQLRPLTTFIPTARPPRPKTNAAWYTSVWQKLADPAVRLTRTTPRPPVAPATATLTNPKP